MKKYFYIIAILIILAAAVFGGMIFFGKSKNGNSAQVLTTPAPGFSLQSFFGSVPSQESSSADKTVQPAGNPDQSTSAAGQTPNPFSTAPDASFSFAVLGDTQRFDSGNPNGNFQKAIANINKINPDMIIAVGDLLSSCNGDDKCAKGYADWKRILGTDISKTYAVQGNHDRSRSSADATWQNAFNFPTNGPADFSEMVYSLDFKNSHFVFLDSDNPDLHQINNTQRAWLEKDLSANANKKKTFVVFHEPAFPVSSKIDESLDVEPDQRNALWSILDKYSVTAVINGHEHIVSRRKIDSLVYPGAKNAIYQFVFGNTDSFDHDLPGPGKAEYSHQGNSFGIFKVRGNEITVDTYSTDNKLLNSFSFSK